MAFKDIAEHLDPTLQLPIRGKVYEIEPVDSDTGLFLQTYMALNTAVRAGVDITDDDVKRLRIDEDDPRDMMQRVLGDTLDELREDGVSFETIKLVAGTVMIWTLQDREAAEVFWNNGGHLPKANRAQRRQKAPAKSARRDSTATTKRGK